MLVKCNKIISTITKEDLGDQSPWLKRGKEYVVFLLNISSKNGVEVCIQTEDYNEPGFFPLNGFEIISQKMPSSWVTTVQDMDDRKIITMLPKSWEYDSFFEDVDDEKPAAVALFNKEVEIMYREEGLID